jgi:hypothetical protein
MFPQKFARFFRFFVFFSERVRIIKVEVIKWKGKNSRTAGKGTGRKRPCF